MNTGTLRTLLLLMLIPAAAAVLLGVLGKVQHWSIADPLFIGGIVMELGCGIGLAILSWKSRHNRKQH